MYQEKGSKIRSTRRRKMKRKLSSRNINTELPNDIQLLIFSKLNLFDLVGCRAVCKSWSKLASTLTHEAYDSKSCTNSIPLFFAQAPLYGSKLTCVDLDPKHSNGMDVVASFSFPPTWSSSRVTIYNSCNGLLLCSSFQDSVRHDCVCVLNPITNEYFKLTSLQNMSDRDYSYGLGCTRNARGYKLLRYHSLGPMLTELDVIAFGRGWTRGSLPCSLQGHGTYLNGSLYWIGVVQHRPRQPSTYAIFRFDLEDEKFDQIPFPSHDELHRIEPINRLLGVLNGDLYLTFLLTTTSEFEAWKMIEDFSWIKVFVVSTLDVAHLELHDKLIGSYYSQACHLQLIKAFEDGKILCLYAACHLFLYDSQTQTTQMLTPNREVKKYFQLYQINCFSFDPLRKILVGDSS